MKIELPVWHRENGEIIACTEKVKVMRENIEELEQIIQDAYEDALLMDVDSNQIKNFLIKMIENLDNPYKEHNV